MISPSAEPLLAMPRRCPSRKRKRRPATQACRRLHKVRIARNNRVWPSRVTRRKLAPRREEIRSRLVLAFTGPLLLALVKQLHGRALCIPGKAIRWRPRMPGLHTAGKPRLVPPIGPRLLGPGIPCRRRSCSCRFLCRRGIVHAPGNRRRFLPLAHFAARQRR